MHENSITTINIMFNSMFNSFLVNKQQLSKVIVQFPSQNVLKLFPSLSIQLFMSLKITGTHEDNN